MDDSARVRLAERSDTPPEMLFFLANDPASAVRAAIAANGATPALADQVLARDSEPGIRRVLARKLASLAPLLDPETTDRGRRTSWDALCLLLEDEVVAVRMAVTERVADLADVPRRLVLRLAQDAAMPVAEPVLRGSPLLQEDDLLALIAHPPASGTLRAIARRPYLPERPCDALAARADEGSVTAMLANATARIREATLIAIARGAIDHPDWGATLVRRPALTAAVVEGLQDLLTGDLLRHLRARTDLGPATPPSPGPLQAEDPDAPGEQASMNEEGFLAAARKGYRGECARILAALSGLPAGIVGRALEARDGAVLVALCWKAGLSAQAATFAQLRLTGARPEELMVLPGGRWAMEEAAMQALVEGLLQARN